MRVITFSIAVLVLLSGCDRTVHQLRDGPVASMRQNESFSVKPTVSSISLKVQPSGSLNPASLSGLNSLLKNQGRLSNQTIRMQPLSEQGEQFAQRLEQSLLELGVQGESLFIQPLVYQEAETAWDLNVVSEAIIVVTPDCVIEDSTTWSVKPFDAVGTLGCANRSNIARMVVNPRDLIRARTLDSADGINAVGAVKRYHEADITPLLDIDFNED